jgi:hypothetical protein
VINSTKNATFAAPSKNKETQNYKSSSAQFIPVYFILQNSKSKSRDVTFEIKTMQ